MLKFLSFPKNFKVNLKFLNGSLLGPKNKYRVLNVYVIAKCQEIDI